MSSDATCAFTRTAIRCGQNRVLIVAIDPNILRENWNSYELREYCNKRYRKTRHEEWKPYPSPFRFVGVGIYNGEGTIDGFDNKLEAHKWFNYQFLVHQKVAEELLGKPLSDTTDKLIDDVIRLIDIAFTARVQLKGNEILGDGCVGESEITLQRTILKLASQVLDAHKKTLKGLDD
jgi:hypothetical protein